MNRYVERFFGTLDEAMQARGVGEFVLGLHLRTVTIYVVTDKLEPLMRTEVLSRPTIIQARKDVWLGSVE